MITRPLGVLGNQIVPLGLTGNLSVQLANGWRQTQSGDFELEERFQTAIFGRDMSGKTVSEVEGFFYGSYLQNQVSAYVDAAPFISSTQLLYETASADIVSPENLATLATGGATDDASIIRLVKNVPQRIRMFIWIEGQDVDCGSSAYADSFAIGLELAGGSN